MIDANERLVKYKKESYRHISVLSGKSDTMCEK